ncbi:ankyrin repeat domain-containing protein [Spongiivirga citrea]|uniref:Ankyrin repeat domain-containing protein n=1 Tax=Spongiivirga citrea TaxID=1481457 RepID=A0A6M0CY46_9FLAO|nr:ankyrin repeat domain-containing protein [Spongiivirga citrea]NER18620.1 ankyrin repeat domain-containing protein [Spongiivirga citrea]
MKKLPVFVLLCLFLSVTCFANVNDLNVETSSKNVSVKVSSFCHAIVKGDMETVKKMISLGEDVNQKSNGLTPLMYAARYNKTNIAELLIEKGAKLKTTCPKGYTAHKYALLSNADDAAKVIEKALKNQKKKKRRKA